MFTDENESRDWIFGAVVTVIVIGGLYWLRSQPLVSEQNATDVPSEPPAVVELISTPAVTTIPIPIPMTGDRGDVGYERVHRRPSIARVYECERNGQRVLGDLPCGSDASVREIAAPNRANAQDTRGLYQAPPRSVQIQKLRAGQGASASASGGNSSVCAQIEESMDRINARMRQRYTSQEGERFRNQLRGLSARRWDAGCGR